MAQADIHSLQIHPDAADPGLAQEQMRFNALVREVATWRTALAGWKERIARYRQVVEPVRRELHAAWRQWVLTLEHASLQPELSRGERAQIAQLVRETATALLEVEDDAEMAAVASRFAEEVSSANASAGPAVTDEFLDDPSHDWEQQAAAAAAQRTERAAKRRADSAAKRRRLEEQEVSRSLRDVYRRLASTLHPDREPDAARRAWKTTLMQQANQAYAEQNLLVLLELQFQAEQIDAAHLASVNRQRLQHYLVVLEEQLADLQSETRRLESGFRAATGLPDGSGLQPRKADRMISSEARRMRTELQLLHRQARSLVDAEATKAWLREHRKAIGD